MKYIATSVAFFLFCCILGAQNLVKNSGFEELEECPTGLRQLEYAKFWKRANAGTPELFHSCGFTSSIAPYEGEGMAGIILLSGYSSMLEYMQTQLYDSLKKGKNYCLSYAIRLAKASPIAINKIGVYFSKEKVFTPNWQRIKIYPQVVNNNIIENKNSWQKVEAVYKAKGGERYLTFGNFFEKYKLREKEVGKRAGDWESYYYLDLIELYEVAENCGNKIALEEEPVNREDVKWSHSVYFAKDSATISNKEMQKLASFFEQLPKPIYQSVKLEGHTDTDASIEYNLQLSQNRVEAVKTKLTLFGLKNIYQIWSGEHKPLNKELTESEQALNRRVEIQIVKQ